MKLEKKIGGIDIRISSKYFFLDYDLKEVIQMTHVNKCASFG